MILFLFLQLGRLASLAIAADAYEIDFRPYNAGSMREEVVYLVDGLARTPVQRRIYTSDNELREASFLQKNGKWAGYGDANLPKQLSKQIAAVNASDPIRIEVKNLPSPGQFDKSVARGTLGNPVILPFVQRKAPQENEIIMPAGIRCEAGDGEFVICSGVIYRRDRTGSIIQALRNAKIEQRTGSNQLGDEGDSFGENPFSNKSAK